MSSAPTSMMMVN